MWAKTVNWLRGAAALWAGLIGAGAVLQHFEVLPKLPKVEPWVWVVSLIIIAVDNLGTLASRRFFSKRAARDRSLSQAAMGLGISLTKAGTVSFHELGVHVYRETWLSSATRKRGADVTLSRIFRFRPSEFPPQSGIRPTAAKGTVGQSWSKKKLIYTNWHAVAKKWAGVDIDEEAFRKIDSKTKQGFAREEFAVICDKYSEILCVPIWDHRRDGTLLGILAVDRAYNADDDQFTTRLDSRETREVVSATASAVSAILKPKSDD